MPFTQEQLVSLGFKKQAALQTVQVAADCWTLPYYSGEALTVTPRLTDNAGEPGTGTPFATQTFKESLQADKSMQIRLCSEWAAMMAVFGVGNFTKSASGDGFKYSADVDTGFSALETDMPVLTMVESVRQGASDVYDLAAIGMALAEFGISLKSGVGRDTAMCTMRWIGCGKYVTPSTITHPAATTVHELNIGQATALTFLTQNYVSNLRLVGLDFNWNNNITVDQNYVIGGGTQNGYNIMGRMRRGRPQVTLRLRVELVDGSAELGYLLGDTTGTGRVTITGDAMGASYHKLDIQFEQLQYVAHKVGGGDNDLLIADIDVSVQRHSSNGVMLFDAYCAQDAIGTASS